MSKCQEARLHLLILIDRRHLIEENSFIMYSTIMQAASVKTRIIAARDPPKLCVAEEMKLQSCLQANSSNVRKCQSVIDLFQKCSFNSVSTN